MTTFSRLAIVNRGEPAMRLLRAVADDNRETGSAITTIALYTDPDAAAWFVRAADEAVSLGPATFADAVGKTRHSYLDRDRLMDALTAAGADAVWVGWGFVAEDPVFAERCEQAGITFVGPSSQVIRRLGDKVAAKRIAETADVPVTPWSGGPVATAGEAAERAAAIGFPLLIKASAGGGGRGIRRVERSEDLAAQLSAARSEAELAFGDGTVFLESLVQAAHHVEVQVIADTHGTVWAAGVRDCSLQRRNQKVLEESATVSVPGPVREAMKAAAVRLCTEAGYHNAGTVEFLFDPSTDAFYFMEVNTRLQVEHPVTELTTGLDLVKLQLHVARGGRLEGEAPPEVGHAVEFRLNAEDPERGFAPTPGRLAHFRMPAGPGVRIDTGVADGDVIAPEFDSMIAKILTYGRDRDEAMARMRRALRESVVIVHGGTTNKAFLLTLLDRPEVVAGEVDTGWLDRLTASGQHVAAHHGACLLAAAVEAYEVDHAAARARFLATAARGRPAIAAEAGRRIDLRFRGRTYTITVHALGGGRYRLAPDRRSVDGRTSDAFTFDAELERLGAYERRFTVGGRRLRVVADIQGPTYQIEVEGIPHRIERDDGGFVRSPAPAVVISFAVEAGDEVASGTPLAVIESMKMETTVAAPFAGRVRSVLVPTNAQVDAGAPLLQLEPLDVDPGVDAAAAGVVDFAGLSTTPATPPTAVARRRAHLEALRSHLLGFDLDEATLRMLQSGLPMSALSVPVDDPGVLRLEREVLDTYADLGGLSRRSPTADEEEAATGASPREHLLTYLRSIDRGPEALPTNFVRRLERALRRYDVSSLERTPQLEDALLWMYRSFLRLPSLAPAVAGILDRWLAGADVLRPALGAAARPLLDRVIDAAEGRAPMVSDLAREVRYSFVDEPLLAGARAGEYAEMDAVLQAIEADPGRADRAQLIERMVASPLPMRPLLLAHAFRSDAPGMREAALEVRIRRYYRIRGLHDLRFRRIDDVTLCLADYELDGRAVLVTCAYGRWTDVDHLLATIATELRSLDDARELVLDLTFTRDSDPVAIEALNSDVAGRLKEADFDRPLHRVDLSVTFSGGGPEHQRTLNLTYRELDGEIVEQELYRNLHPMLAKRIGLWRLGNFDIARLSSVEDVYLMLATARDNPADHRLFAIAEVRDLTPLTDEDDEIVALPLLERMVLESFSAMRRHLSHVDPRKRPLHNRLVLYVRPPWQVPPRAWRSLARRLAPASVGLGLEKVVLRVRVPDADGRLVDEVLHVENLDRRGVVVRREAPADRPIRTLTPYRQRVLRTEQRGGVYPYELLRRLTPSEDSTADFPAGDFTEYDLDEHGDFVPVEREPGGNTANLVVGTIRNRTHKVPEGMERGIILGDPSRSLGSLAEAECRRIIAVLDLAEERGVPVEWFAVSSGARISMESGTENMDWIAAVLRRLIEFTQAGGEVNVVVTGINVGAQPYWNAEATMLMHTRGILVMTPASAMVLTGKQALDFSGGVSAEDNFGIGGFDRIMGPNGQGQYWAPTLEAACEVLFDHYAHTYRVPGERFPRRAETSDPADRDVQRAPHAARDGSDFSQIADIFSSEANPDRKKPFDMRSLMRAVADTDSRPLERWLRWRDAETVITWDAHLGGMPVAMIGIESHPVQRYGFAPADGPTGWTSGTLFPQSSRKCARALNAASGNRPAVVLANLSGFDGSPESMREWQLEYGAEIGRAVTNFDGPIVFCVVSRYHGGAFVVFSKPLNEGLEIAAVEGSYASVIGGTPAAAVVFARDVRRRTDSDPRVAAVRDQIGDAAPGQAAALRGELERVRSEVHAEMIGVVADEFDTVHSIERAQRVGSVDRIIAPADLRPYLIDAVERGMRRVKEPAPTLG